MSASISDKRAGKGQGHAQRAGVVPGELGRFQEGILLAGGEVFACVLSRMQPHAGLRGRKGALEVGLHPANWSVWDATFSGTLNS